MPDGAASTAQTVAPAPTSAEAEFQELLERLREAGLGVGSDKVSAPNISLRITGDDARIVYIDPPDTTGIAGYLVQLLKQSVGGDFLVEQQVVHDGLTTSAGRARSFSELDGVYKARAQSIPVAGSSPSDWTETPAERVIPSPDGAPAQPNAPTITAANNVITVVYAYPADNGGSAFTRMSLELYAEGTPARRVDIGGQGFRQGTSYDFVVATTGSYKVRVAANNVDTTDENRRWSDFSNTVSVSTVVDAQLPAPTEFLATGREESVRLTARVDGVVTRWEFRQADTMDAIASASWASIADSADRQLDHTVTSLTNGTEYWFQARAVNDVGNSPESAATPGTPDVAAAPSVPANAPVWSAGSPSVAYPRVILQATVPEGVQVNRWQYRFSTLSSALAAVEWTDVLDSEGNLWDYPVLNTSVWDVQPSTTYYFQVRIVNDAGQGAPTSSSSVTIPAFSAPVVTSFTVQALDGRVRLNARRQSRSYAQLWEYRFSTTTQGLTAAAWADAGEHDALLNQTYIDGLENGTTYYFQVRGTNNAGVAGAPSAVVSATPMVQVHSSPTVAALVGTERLTIEGSVPSGTVTKWQYKLQDLTFVTANNAYFASRPWVDIADSDARAINQVLSGLLNGFQYSGRVRVVNSAGNSPSAVIVGTPNTAGAPPRPQSSGGDYNYISTPPGGPYVLFVGPQVTHFAASSDGVTSWEWRYAQVPIGGPAGRNDPIWTATWTTVPASSSAIQITLPFTTGLRYYVQLRAVNAIGKGAYFGQQVHAF